MAARLRSISGTIPWWLILKSALFAAAWLWAPFWLFLLIAAGLYFFPLFEPGAVLWPFLASLFFAAVLSPNWIAALALGATFYLILGIKDLILINRAPAFEALVFLLFGLGFLNFFARFRLSAPDLLPSAAGLGLMLLLLHRSLFRYEKAENIGFGGLLLPGLLLFLWGGWAFALLFLPLNLFFGTAILLLASVSATELVLSRSQGTLDRREILVHFSILFAFIAIALAANTWKI